MAYRPHVIENMLKEYSKLGLDNNQLNQIRNILTTGKNVGPEITNKLITAEGYDDLFTGRRYIDIDSTGRPYKNRPGITQSRNNLLQFIDSYKSTPKPAVTAPIQTTAPTPKSIARVFNNNPELAEKLGKADLKILNDVANDVPAPKPQTPTPKPTQAQNFASQRLEQVKQVVKPKPKPSANNAGIKDAMRGVSGKPKPPLTTKQLLQGVGPKGPAKPIIPKTTVSPTVAKTAAKGLLGGITARGLASGGARLAGGNVITLAEIPGSSPTDNWRQLGYPSKEAHDKVKAANSDNPKPLIQLFPEYDTWDKVPVIGGLLKAIGMAEPEKATTPKNNLTKLEDGSMRTGGGDVYSADGKRYTSGGVTYDLASGQAVNPKTNEISSTGYSIDPSSGERFDSPGMDTTSGRSFQSLQQGLMDRLAIKEDLDPRTTALIRGVPTNPFSSTQLPYTEDNLFTSSIGENDLPDFGIDPSKMLDRSKEIDYAETAKNLPGFDNKLTFDDRLTGNYVSPVNYDQPQTVKDPMLLKGVSGMTAMRMKDRDLGLMYASGQFFAEGADGNPVLVNRDLAKSVRRGDEGAKDQLAAYLAGGGIKPQGGVIANPTMEQMTPPTQSKAESLVDPAFDRSDYEVMGGNPENSPLLSRGGAVQMDIDRNFDLENPNTSQIGPLQHPFSKVLAENPVNQAAKPQVVDTDKYGSVTSLINKYGIDDYLKRMDAGQFF